MKEDKLLRSIGYIDQDLIEGAKTGSQIVEKENSDSNRVNPKVSFFRGRRFTKTAALVAVLTTVGVGSVFGYDYVRNNGMYQRTALDNKQELFTEYVDGNGNAYQYDYKQIGENVNSGNLAVTLNGYYVQDDGVYMDFAVATLDGTGIYEMNENKVPDLGSDLFKEVKLIVNGNEVTFENMQSNHCTVSRIDDCSAADQARIVVSCVNEETAFDKDDQIQIELSNYGARYTEYQDIGLKYVSVAEMFAGAAVGDNSAFDIETDKNGQTKGTLLPGTMHIAFSSVYPEAYVDNAGFIDQQIYDGKHTVEGSLYSERRFVMTVVPGSDQAAAALKDLRFVNKSTGSQMGNGMVQVLDDGRIQVTYNVNSDRYYKDKIADRADTQLEHLTLQTCKVVVKDHEFETYSDGTWGFEYKIQSIENVKKTIDEEVIVSDERNSGNTEAYLGVSQLQISGTQLNIKLYGGYEYAMQKFLDQTSPVIIMKNGTQIQTERNNGFFGKVLHSNEKVTGVTDVNAYETVEGEIGCSIPSIVDVDEIASITMLGVEIYHAE